MSVPAGGPYTQLTTRDACGGSASSTSSYTP
eukprot:CAMPEP_0177527180 /NCGR_PEP_ID=MMETSP0369-20130122/51486_1 /TAXON_ID=447022 ORGANISM="Scrippsiella hangoei-like, Strain SHHI-4" /NCGR_SAMPLE_ID=MMETSP0369 /ASSEMBLY_ACC=CAM_ASM_000364 /LENGTH=30 /DNA_ID= /DNA_START= /DNA_END= /DNA_ORIENTATION=